jgi:hypothetical protein
MVGVGRRVGLLVVVCLCLALPAPAALATPSGNVALETVQPSPTRDQIAARSENLPLQFEANQGQADPQVDFIAHSGSYTIFLTAGEAVLAARGGATASTQPQALGLQLQGANPAAVAVGVDELPGTTNYLVGDDPTHWRTGIPSFARVRYAAVYSGIDVVYYSGANGHMEYDYVVAPGADPGVIQLGFPGAQSTNLSDAGDLVLDTAGGAVRLQPPVAYQTIDGVRKAIPARYVQTDAERVGFEIGTYDPERELVIDPVVVYATLLGGSGVFESATAVAVDAAGNVYLTGSTDSVDFPTTAGAFQRTAPDVRLAASNVFVSKLNPSGTGLVYSTYIGGAGEDFSGGIAIDATGHVYVSGLTTSAAFPTTPGAFRRSDGGDQQVRSGADCGHTGFHEPCFDVFVSKLNPTGTALDYSTLIGQTFLQGLTSDSPRIAVDSTGHAYIVGTTESVQFPTTPGAFQPAIGGEQCGSENDPTSCYDAFVTKLNPTGSGLVYSSYLGGRGQDFGQGIAVDANGSAYLVGWTQSATFPTTAGALQRQWAGARDAFVTKVNPAGTALVYSTFVGGSGFDTGSNIAIDGTGSAYISGITSTDYPTTSGVIQPRPSNRPVNAFLSKLNPAGSALAYSTYLGGGSFLGVDLAVDPAGHAFLAGSAGPDVPTTPGANRSGQGFLIELNATASGAIYATRLGDVEGSATGIALDRSGNAYVSGFTRPGFVTTPGAFQRTPRGVADGFVIKIAPGPPACEIVALVPGPPAQLRVAVHADRGLDKLVITESTNVTVALPSFTRGSTDTLLVTATKVKQSDKAIVALRATDVTGASTTCDPVITTVGRGAGEQPFQVMRGVPAAESHVTIINATPGVDRIWLVVNSKLFKVTDLQDGEKRTLDVASAMRAGSNNTIRVIALAPNGGSAMVFVSDSV